MHLSARRRPTAPVPVPASAAFSGGVTIGTLTIPKLKRTLPIVQGTDAADLERGVGHFAGSVMPGVSDNCVLSGHRDTVFRDLGSVGVGDWLIVRTPTEAFGYLVRRVRIVGKHDRTVIVPTKRATLTVTTCYPFHWVGPAPRRYVLVAELALRKKL